MVLFCDYLLSGVPLMSCGGRGSREEDTPQRKEVPVDLTDVASVPSVYALMVGVSPIGTRRALTPSSMRTSASDPSISFLSLT